MSNNRSNMNMVALRILMTEGKIPGVSIASFDSTGTTSSTVLGVDHQSKAPLTEDSVFRAASLSKPVFAYLVVKLIEDNKQSNKAKEGLGKFKQKFDLDTPLYTVYPQIFDKFKLEDRKKVEKLTARHILAHQTGLPLNKRDNEQLSFQIDPGTGYGYSNPGIALLQEVVEHITGNQLQTLAQENIFGPNALNMSHSTFTPPKTAEDNTPSAVNSLHTTASDYAKFVSALLSDDKLCALMFEGQNITMETDLWAVEQGLSKQDLQKVTWGLGWGLQVDADGKKAFHSGDMNEWRAFVAIDVDKKKGVVFFSNSPNGLLLADKIIQPNVSLKQALNYIFQKYGFARKVEPDWQKKQIDRVIKIITKFELNLPDLLKKGSISFNDNKGLCTLSIECDPKYALLIKALMNELAEFKEKHGLKYDKDCFVKTQADTKGNISSLSINITNKDLYDKFIEHLNVEKLLPQQVNAPREAQASTYKSPTPTSTRLTRNRK